MLKRLSVYIGEYKQWVILAPTLVILEVLTTPPPWRETWRTSAES